MKLDTLVISRGIGEAIVFIVKDGYFPGKGEVYFSHFYAVTDAVV